MGCGKSITRLPPERVSVPWQRPHLHRNIAVLKPETPGLFCIAEMFDPHDARHSGCRQKACTPFGKHRYQPDVNHRSCIDRAGTSGHQRGPYYGEFSFVATTGRRMPANDAFPRRLFPTYSLRDRQEASTQGKPNSENCPVKEQRTHTTSQRLATRTAQRCASRSLLFPQQHQKSPGLGPSSNRSCATRLSTRRRESSKGGPHWSPAETWASGARSRLFSPGKALTSRLHICPTSSRARNAGVERGTSNPEVDLEELTDEELDRTSIPMSTRLPQAGPSGAEAYPLDAWARSHHRRFAACRVERQAGQVRASSRS